MPAEKRCSLWRLCLSPLRDKVKRKTICPPPQWVANHPSLLVLPANPSNSKSFDRDSSRARCTTAHQAAIFQGVPLLALAEAACFPLTAIMKVSRALLLFLPAIGVVIVWASIAGARLAAINDVRGTLTTSECTGDDLSYMHQSVQAAPRMGNSMTTQAEKHKHWNASPPGQNFVWKLTGQSLPYSCT